MSGLVFPHFGAVEMNGILFDRTAAGALTRSSGEGAFWVLMRPEIFLALATPLPNPRASIKWISDHVEAGNAIAPSELVVRLPSQGTGAVSSHEGRHRMTVMSRRGVSLAPVRISITHSEDCDIDQALIAHVRRGLRAQRGGAYVEGPLFGDGEVDLGGWGIRWLPPPDYGCRPSLF